MHKQSDDFSKLLTAVALDSTEASVGYYSTVWVASNGDTITTRVPRCESDMVPEHATRIEIGFQTRLVQTAWSPYRVNHTIDGAPAEGTAGYGQCGFYLWEMPGRR